MSYRFIFDDMFNRTIPAVMIDARKGTPLANQIGNVIKGLTDAEVAKVVAGVLPYKIEALANGGLVGYITINTNLQPVSVYQQLIRPNFQQFIVQINQEISNFIKGNDWVYDSI